MGVMRQHFSVSALENKIFRNWGPSVFRRECDYSGGNLGHSRRQSILIIAFCDLENRRRRLRYRGECFLDFTL